MGTQKKYKRKWGLFIFLRKCLFSLQVNLILLFFEPGSMNENKNVDFLALQAENIKIWNRKSLVHAWKTKIHKVDSTVNTKSIKSLKNIKVTDVKSVNHMHQSMMGFIVCLCYFLITIVDISTSAKDGKFFKF